MVDGAEEFGGIGPMEQIILLSTVIFTLRKSQLTSHNFAKFIFTFCVIFI